MVWQKWGTAGGGGEVNYSFLYCDPSLFIFMKNYVCEYKKSYTVFLFEWVRLEVPTL